MRLLNRFSRSAAEPGRNDPCPCGSGRKFKHCCANKPAAVVSARPVPEAASGPEPRLKRIAALREAGRFLEAARQAETTIAQYPADAGGHNELGLVHLVAGRAAEALPCFLRAARLAPDVAQHHAHAGFALEQLGRDNEAVTAYRQAVRLDPHHPEALERLGIVLLTFDLREEAMGFFRRAADAQPDTAAGAINRARVLFDDGEAAEAEALLRRTVAQYPAHTEAKRTLANTLRERGDFAEAIPLLQEATEGSPVQAATAYFDLVMSQRIGPDDQPMLDRMLALLDYRPLSQIGRQRVHFGMGKALDDLGDYDAAMRQFDAGNRIAARSQTFDRSHFGAGVQRLIDGTTAEFLLAHQDLGSVSDLPVLILGMPRSGTTLVEQIVSSHPAVAGGDELPFWNHAAERFGKAGETDLSEAYFQRIAAAYEQVLRRISSAASRVTDKMPGNFLWIGLFHLVFPKGRIIHCRRHPVDTGLSNYFANFSARMPFAYDKGDLAFYYRWYERLMAHWRDVLPPGTMLEVDYEDLVDDPERVTRQMIGFLGLPWDDACLRPEDNDRVVKTASQWQARQPTYRTSKERWRRYEPWLGELRTLLDPDEPDMAPQPESGDPKIGVSRRLRAAGRLDEAIAALQQAIRDSANDPVLYNDLGTLFLATEQVDLAIECFERALGLHPNFAKAQYNLGAGLEGRGQPEAAIVAHRRAIAADPSLANAYSRLGNLLNTRGALDEAQACFRQAAALTEDPADRALEEAKILLMEGRSAEAEAALRQSLALNDRNSLAHAMLGNLLGETGRFDAAIKSLETAIELDPDRVGAWHNLTLLRKTGQAERSFVDRMAGRLRRPGRTESDKIVLHFALGKAHDDLCDYEAAIHHYDLGNRLEHGRHLFDRDALTAEIDRQIATYTVDSFARGTAAGRDSALPLPILGMPRSGTTLVEQIVSAHPKVGGGGELTFWTERVAKPESIERMADDYLALLRGLAPGAARVTDKNPFNFLHIGMIHQALPNARMIHTRRHPVDTCLSIFFTRFATAQPFAYDREDLVFYYREYERLMAHWETVLPKDRLLTVDYEDLTADPESVIRPMLAFVGLEWDDACLMPERNQRQVRTASVWQARQPVYRGSVARWRHYRPWLGELRALLRPGDE